VGTRPTRSATCRKDGDDDDDFERDDVDSRPAVPKAVVIDPHFDWQGVPAPKTPDARVE
jgi:pullulanase/glycogen debranching enzyme